MLVNSLSKFSTICLLAAAIVLGSSNINIASASASSRSQDVDNLTDSFFARVNPELNGRKLQSNDRGYIREWNAIRTIVDQEVESRPLICGRRSTSWGLSDPQKRNDQTNQALDRVTDTIFYRRNPDMQGRKIGAADRAAAREWSAIRQRVNLDNRCGC